MILSRLFLNPRSRQVQREIADPYEMHRTIMQAFPSLLDKSERVLWRLELQPQTHFPTLLVQSHGMQDWQFLHTRDKDWLLPAISENPVVKHVDIKLLPDQTLVFRLLANPIVKKDRPDKKQGHRIGLINEEDQLKWIKRKLSQAGAVLVSIQISPKDHVKGKLFRNDEKHDLNFLSVKFDGILQVSDPQKLIDAIETGIGPGKGLGFGLLSLAPFHS